MTAYEFRGFIANLILITLSAGGVIALTWDNPLPWWAYVILGLVTVILFPLPVADFKRRPFEDAKVLVPDHEKRITR